MPNIKFEYLFRDENNYKEYGEVIFSNTSKISLKFIKGCITENLIEDLWFYPNLWGIPKFSFHNTPSFGYNDSIWYEFTDVSETSMQITISTEIEEFTTNAKHKY